MWRSVCVLQIFSISFALYTHTSWMNIMNHQHTGQGTIPCCLFEFSALQRLLQCCDLKAWVTKLLLFTVQTRFISIQWSLGNWEQGPEKNIASQHHGKNFGNSDLIYVLSNIVQARHHQLGVILYIQLTQADTGWHTQSASRPDWIQPSESRGHGSDSYSRAGREKLKV